MKFLLALLTLITTAFAAPDLLIYGSTPGGIAAAVSAAEQGREVTIVEPTERIGGMLTSGLSYSDFRTFESITGFYLDFSTRVSNHYSETYGADSPQAKSNWRGTMGEPSVNLLVLQEMIEEQPKISVKIGQRLISVETSPFTLGRRRIISATFTTADGAEKTMPAKMFIDASYEGDLFAAAGENFHVGRESRSQYGEPLAGDENGDADGQVQGYNFRLCMTTVEENKLYPPAPEGYDRKDFTPILPLIAAGKITKIFDSAHAGIYRAHLPLLPNGKTDVNDAPNAPARMSMPDINDEWPLGDHATRQRIFDQHLYYNIGLLHFLQNDSEVPENIRADARLWALCKDEFTETGGIPPQLYVREARRLVGQHVFTANDTRTAEKDARAILHPDSIAMGDYIHNCHGTGRTGTRYDGEHTGQFFDKIQPFQMKYGIIVPQKTTNLLVPVACSASHFGFGTLRLEAPWTSLGQAAGLAAHLALETGSPVQKINIPDLQKLLLADHSALIYLSDVPPSSPDFAAAQWWGLRGGFHGLVTVDEPRQPEFITGQYSKAFPEHYAELDKALTPELHETWSKLLPGGATASELPCTRREFINAAYGNR